MTDTQTEPVATGVEDELETLASHVEDSDAENDVHEALATVKTKVDTLVLGAETDAKTIAEHIATIAEKDATIAEKDEALAAKTVATDAGLAAADIHKDLTAIKTDAFQAVRSDRMHSLMVKIEALIAKIETVL